MPKKQKFTTLRLILGDQLNINHSWFSSTHDETLYVLMEIKPESEYVTHHIQKIVGIFQAMRTFHEELVALGHQSKYIHITDQENLHSFTANINALIKAYDIQKFEYQEPDEYRLDLLFRQLCESLSVPGEMFSTEHFLTTRMEVRDFFEGKKTFLMENFYRYMRKKHNILMEGDQPLSGKWNHDKSNRNKLPKDHQPPHPKVFRHDVSALIEEIEKAGLKSIGNIQASDFIWPKNRSEALELLDFFINNMLMNFGQFQDALTNKSWSVYHSRISFAMNIKLISPAEVIQKVEAHFYGHSDIDIAAAEGFIRQILGWREYMRGLYWAKMPEYSQLNYFDHQNPLPDYFWTGKTKMNCLKTAIGQSLDYAYAHHIQRLMITGNFALLAGIHPDEVDAWYLGIYIDAFEWVEITNTRGMSQYADGGIVASKPYTSSAAYIKKMGDHCDTCYYNHNQKTGKKACPFNSLYWNFIDLHSEKLQSNPRMGMMLNLWKKMDGSAKEELLQQAALYLDDIQNL